LGVKFGRPQEKGIKNVGRAAPILEPRGCHVATMLCMRSRSQAEIEV